ncbi:protein containing AIR synthase related protein, partial [mine drainage metagenome]
FLPVRRLQKNRARRAGHLLVLAGGRTGRDGIGGVAFASRELTEVSGSESRGAVQLGNPILKEPLIRACLEAFEAGYVASVKDLGGGGSRPRPGNWCLPEASASSSTSIGSLSGRPASRRGRSGSPNPRSG